MGAVYPGTCRVCMEAALTKPGQASTESPPVCRRLRLLGRMGGSCREDLGATRRSCGTNRQVRVGAARARTRPPLDHFFDDLGADRAQAIQAVSMDMSPAFRKSVSTHAGQAVICYDPFHVVALGATAALDKVRRAGQGPPRGVAGTAQGARPGRRTPVPRSPLGADEESKWPDR